MRSSDMGCVSLITCIDENGYIGDGNNRLVTRITEDMMRFKTLTMGNTVVMGMNTFRSLNSHPLKGRRNIVVTSAWKTENDLIGVAYQTMEDTQLTFIPNLEYLLEHDELVVGDLLVIGGGQIYRRALEIMEFDSIYITVTHMWDIKWGWLTDKSNFVSFPMDALRENIRKAHGNGRDVTERVYPANNPLKKDGVEYKFYRIDFCKLADGKPYYTPVVLNNDKYYWELGELHYDEI